MNDERPQRIVQVCTKTFKCLTEMHKQHGDVDQLAFVGIFNK